MRTAVRVVPTTEGIHAAAMKPSAPSMESASTPVTAATLRHHWLYQPNGRDCERYANYP